MFHQIDATRAQRTHRLRECAAYFVLPVVAFLACAAPSLRAADDAQPAERMLLAGAAASNITPPLGSPIVGGWLSPPATHIHDELFARCLVLDDGETRIAFVICDSVGIPREVFDAAKEMAHRATGIAADHMLMAATHTHSAASTRSRNRYVPEAELNDYQSFVVRRIADGVARAANQLEPARIGWGSADDPRHLFNRRYYMKPTADMVNPFGGIDQVMMNPGIGNPEVIKPAGPIDPQISFLSVQSADGRPLALLANYSLHYVGGTGAADISADYFGMFADRIQQLLGADRLDPPFVGIMTNGTSGDVNNNDVLGKPRPRKAPYEQMRYVAHAVADKVYDAHQKIEFRNWVDLAMAQRELVLVTRKPTPEILARATKLLAGEIEPHHKRDLDYAKRAHDIAKQADEISIVLQAVRIGDLGIATIPFEVFTETGLEIKRRSALRPTFTIELANGSYGYLPTPEQHALGGYETWLGTNNVEIEASRKITETLLDMLEQLK